MLVKISLNPISGSQIIENAIFDFCRIERVPYVPPLIERERGKPIVTNLPLYISLTHSNKITAAAVSFEPVGIDLEFKKKIDYKAVAKRFFEKMPLDSDEFFSLWTAKEAYAKALNIPLVSALRLTDYSKITTLNIIKDCALSVWGDGKIYFVV